MEILIIIVSIIVILAGIFLYLRNEKKKTQKTTSGSSRSGSVNNFVGETSKKDNTLDNLVLATVIADSNDSEVGLLNTADISDTTIKHGTDLNDISTFGYYKASEGWDGKLKDNDLPVKTEKVDLGYSVSSYKEDDYKKNDDSTSFYYTQSETSSNSSSSGYSVSESSSSSYSSGGSCDSGSSYDSSSSCSSSSSSDW
jgi:hypothetical protein